MEFLELIKVTFISFTVFMVIVITVSYTVYKVKKKNQPPKQAVVPQIITSKKVEQKQVVTLPPPKPTPMKVKVPAPGTQQFNNLSQPANYEKLVSPQIVNPEISGRTKYIQQVTTGQQTMNRENIQSAREFNNRTLAQTQPNIQRTTSTQPQERFQVMNRPENTIKSSSGIAYYGSERLSYQPPSYLKIDPPKPQDSFRNKYSGS